MKWMLNFLLLMAVGCSSYEKSMDNADKYMENEQNNKALNSAVKAINLAKSLQQKKNAFKKTVAICERKLKDYACALNSYAELLPMAKSNKERQRYHFNMGSIYFLHLQDYEKALVQFSEAAEICADPVMCMEAKIKISQSYYYKKDYKQAITEIEDLNKTQKEQDEITDSTKFIEAAILHAQALMGLENYNKAVEPLEEAMETFPQEATKLKVPLVLSVAYRENKMLAQAIKVLKKFKNQTEDTTTQAYAEAQIKKMKERLQLQPGGPSGKRIRR